MSVGGIKATLVGEGGREGERVQSGVDSERAYKGLSGPWVGFRLKRLGLLLMCLSLRVLYG